MEPCLRLQQGVFNQCRCPTFSICLCVCFPPEPEGGGLLMAAVTVVVMVEVMVMRWHVVSGFAPKQPPPAPPRVYWQTLFGDGYSWVDNTDHVVIA